MQLGIFQNELGGSEYVTRVTGEALGKTPRVDLDAEKQLIDCCLDLIGQGLLRSAHDISDGGLAVALAESSFAAEPGAAGASIAIDSDIRADALLFGESQARMIGSIDPHDLNTIQDTAARYGVPVSVIGTVTADDLAISVNGTPLIRENTRAIQAIWQGAIACSMK